MKGGVGHAPQVWRALLDYPRTDRRAVCALSAAMAATIALVDLRLTSHVSLGFLYILPLVLTAGYFARWQIVILAAVCAVLREAGSPMAWSDDYLARMVLVAAAFSGVALFVKELARNQKLALEHVRQLELRQKLEEQFRHAQRLESVGRLAGGVAHDFNNLLSVIIGYGDLILGRMGPDDPLRKDMQQIRQSADQAALLTRQLLTFSRRQGVRPHALDLNSLVSNLHQMLHRLIGEDIDLKLVLQPGLGMVCADAGQLEQVIMNLAVNARDAMPNGGSLTIQTAGLEVNERLPFMPPHIKPGRYVTMEVRDTGVGMDASVQEHLFEPFFTTKEVGKGTGLGLSTVYGIVRQNEGEIWFSSLPGEGAVFTIYLPRSEADPVASDERRLPAGGGSEAILLVEDEEAVRQLAGQILKSAGYRVTEAAGPAAALSIAENLAFDLLVTDVVMPQIGGRELAKRLAQRRPGMKVLFMTGYSGATVFPEGAGCGGVLLQKPFTQDELLRSVRAALAVDAISRRAETAEL
ncbi:MAG TPA: response regulator [Bryobacteraceae bacterium]|jgi:signal transduction histidine kinase/CheY-like chemotaxis protein|nr:response regulator [Bryobacteraceae bacterium]